MMSQPVKKILAIHIMPSTLGSKGNQAMKFGHLTWKTFFYKNHTKCDGEPIYRPLS